MYRQLGRLVGRQVDRHARIYIASFEPAKLVIGNTNITARNKKL